MITLTGPGSGVIYYGVEMGIFDQFVYNSPSIPLNIASGGTPGSPVPGTALQVAGTDGTNLRTLATDTAGHLLVNTYANPYPSGAVPSGGSSGVLTNAAGAASIAAVVGKTCWLTGFEVTYTGATAGSTQSPSISGLAQGTMYYVVDVAAGASSSGNTRLLVSFPYPLPASSTNTAITLSLPAAGAGGFSAGNIHGYTI